MLQYLRCRIRREILALYACARHGRHVYGKKISRADFGLVCSISCAMLWGSCAQRRQVWRVGAKAHGVKVGTGTYVRVWPTRANRAQ